MELEDLHGKCLVLSAFEVCMGFCCMLSDAQLGEDLSQVSGHGKLVGTSIWLPSCSLMLPQELLDVGSSALHCTAHWGALEASGSCLW